MTRTFALLLLAASPLAAVDYYVSPTGSDTNAGTLTAPFASLTKARDTIRTLKTTSGLPSEGVTVWLRGGEHHIASTVSFDSKDSGVAGKPIVYRSYVGEEARITGAKALPGSAFRLLDAASPVWSRIDSGARGKVMVADLKANGFANFGTLRNRGFNMTAVAQMELISDDAPMTLARWPNAGEALVKSDTAPAYNKITYSENRPARWASFSDVWVHGCLANTWTDFHLKISALDQASKTITFTSGPGSFATTRDQPYYFYNLLEEIDQPGEYYIDRTAGLLYYWPKSQNVTSENLRLTLTEGTLLQFNGTAHLKLLDLVVQNGRGGLINVISGNAITMQECVIQASGTYGVSVNGTNHLITNCDITNTGEDGVILQGGVRATLSAGNNAVTNSRIHRTSRISWTFHPAVNLVKGCGNIVRNNLIDDLPHSGIVFSGNNHIMELNEIREVCKLTSDTSAIYAGTDWGYRGNVIKNNLIHNVWSSQEGYGAHGVYLDDCMSGVEVTGNIIYNVSHVGVLVGGGRDNIIKGNVIAKCSIAHSNDDRGRTRIVNTPGATMNMLERLAKDNVSYQTAPWSTAYPALARVPNSWSVISTGTWRNPENNVLSSNVGWSNSRWTYESNTSGTGVFSLYASMANNASNATPLFVDAVVNDRSERPASLTASVSGFNAIPFFSIGRMTTAAPAVPKPPAAPAVNMATVTGQEVKLEWSNRSNLPSNKVLSFQIERRNVPDGSWTRVATVGEEVGVHTIKGLAPAKAYQLRVVAVNNQGTAASNPVAITTGEAPYVEGVTKRYEAEDHFTILNDVPTLRRGIDSYDAVYDSAKSLRIYDPGDKIRIPVTVPSTGLYRVTYRGTSGGAINNTSFWPNGYLLDVDGVRTGMHGVYATLSPADNSYGNVYWGSMKTEALTLTAGSHNLDITSGAAWAVADYIEVTAIQPPALTNYANWAVSNFATDQDSSKLGNAAGDGISNLGKYALGLSVWTKYTSQPLTATVDANRLVLTYSVPAGLTDVAYVVEVSNDQSSWTAVNSAVVNTSGGMTNFRAVDTTGNNNKYLRLKVTSGGVTSAFATLTAAGLVDNSTPRQLALTNDEIVAARAIVNVNSLSRVSSTQKGTLSFFFTGAGSSKLLVRHGGPFLANLGMANTAADPALVVYNGSNTAASNNDWASSTAMTSAISSTGAVPFGTGSKDAAAIVDAVSGQYDLIGTGNGMALLEGFRYSSTTSAVRGFAAKSTVALSSSMTVGFTIDTDEAFNVDITLSTTTLTGATLGATLSKDGVPVGTSWSGVGGSTSGSSTKMVALRRGSYTLTVTNSSDIARDAKVALHIKSK